MNTNRADSFKQFTIRDTTRERISAIQSVTGKEVTSIVALTDEACILYELAANYHANDPILRGYCLELGTYKGGSASIIATALRQHGLDSPLFTLDRTYQPETEEKFRQLGLTHDVCQIIYDDLSYLRFWHLPTRFIYLDSNHQYAVVKEAIPLLMRCLAPGGWLAMHDYIDESWSGVISAVNEFLDTQKLYDLEVFIMGTLVCIKKSGSYFA